MIITSFERAYIHKTHFGRVSERFGFTFLLSRDDEEKHRKAYIRAYISIRITISRHHRIVDHRRNQKTVKLNHNNTG